MVKLLKRKKAIGFRWVYRIKYNSNGTLGQYKATLAVKGYTQTYGFNYLQIFAPVAKMNTVRVSLSMTVNYGWKLHQVDL